MTTDVIFFRRGKIWQTIQRKRKSFVRSSGVFSRSTGSSGRTRRAGREGDGDKHVLFLRGAQPLTTKLSGSEAIKENTEAPTREKPVRTGQGRSWGSGERGGVGCCPGPQRESAPDSVRVAKVTFPMRTTEWSEATGTVTRFLFQELALGFLGIYLVI